MENMIEEKLQENGNQPIEEKTVVEDLHAKVDHLSEERESVDRDEESM